MDLTVIIPTINEADNLRILLPRMKQVLDRLALPAGYEILIMDGPSTDGTEAVAREYGARYVRQKLPGYGGAMRDAFAVSHGDYIVTIDADLSHNPYIIKQLYQHRQRAEIVIASRYVRAGFARMPRMRKVMSWMLNRVFCYVLDLPLNDISSGFRLYRRRALMELELSGVDYDVLEEIIVAAFMAGFRVTEIPFHYTPRHAGKSHVRLIAFAWAYLKMLFKLWRRRNSIKAADYDERAFHSKILIQRAWQRARYRHILDLLEGQTAIADLGCGSSKIVGALPQAVAMDVLFNKLRHLRMLPNGLVQGSVFALPFKSDSFEAAICSQVIEHIPAEDVIFEEFRRILRDNGILILGTPDYGRWRWRVTEWIYGKVMPGGYADEHITHYTFDSLVARLKDFGFTYLTHRYVGGGELIIKARKMDTRAS